MKYAKRVVLDNEQLKVGDIVQTQKGLIFRIVKVGENAIAGPIYFAELEADNPVGHEHTTRDLQFEVYPSTKIIQPVNYHLSLWELHALRGHIGQIRKIMRTTLEYTAGDLLYTESGKFEEAMMILQVMDDGHFKAVGNLMLVIDDIVNKRMEKTFPTYTVCGKTGKVFLDAVDTGIVAKINVERP